MDLADRFTDAVAELDAVAAEITPQDAAATFDETTLQNFWRDWTRLSQWAGSLWRILSEDLEAPSRPVTDPELDEVGGAG